MLRLWIRNSSFSEMQEAFPYVTCAKDLWDSFKGKFGQKNGMFLSKLKKAISNLK